MDDGKCTKQDLTPNFLLRFPSKGDWTFGEVQAVLDKCTQTHIVVRRPEINIATPSWFQTVAPEQVPHMKKLRTTPEQTASVPLTFVSVAEDVKHKRPMIVFDHSF